MYPKIIKQLIEDFAKLPGIGEKSAERLVLQLINKSDEYLADFAMHLASLKSAISHCPVCGLLIDDQGCVICNDLNRKQDIIMVLADSKDAYALEKSQAFNGRYHILGGLLNFAKGIDPSTLNIDSLLVHLAEIKEIIIATNATIEGEITAAFLKKLLEEKAVLVTRLAYGIPVGLDLKYADLQTLALSVKNRQKY